MNLDTLHRTQVDAGTVGGLPRFDADNYVCELLSVPSHDNAMVPLTVVRRRDTVLHGRYTRSAVNPWSMQRHTCRYRSLSL